MVHHKLEGVSQQVVAKLLLGLHSRWITLYFVSALVSMQLSQSLTDLALGQLPGQGC